MIEFNQVSKEFKNITALKDVSLTIQDGEFVFLIGASGAGKSTLIRLLLRELTPTQGSVVVNGKNLAQMKNREIPAYRRTIGMVFQDFKLIPTLNVFENVAFAMRVTNAKSADINRRVPEVLEMVGIGDRGTAFPNELSGGEQQRVSIARALVNKPAMLIADEPTGNLDPQTSWEIMDILSKVNETGTTVLMATHGRELVDEMKRRVIVLDDGVIARDEEEGSYDHD